MVLLITDLGTPLPFPGWLAYATAEMDSELLPNLAAAVAHAGEVGERFATFPWQLPAQLASRGDARG